MKRKILISILVLLAVQPLASATDRYVPSRTYPTIKSAIIASVNGDTVIVAPGVYSGDGNRNLDFSEGLPSGQTRAITVRSDIDPANPNWVTIANTIIDCGGKPPHTAGSDTGKANRAFHFRSGEDADSRLIGFTIINGYARGPKGRDGEEFYDPYIGDPPIGTPPDIVRLNPEPTADDPLTAPPLALDGEKKIGDASGGAILCTSGSSPTIKYCVIRDCTVIGAEGGKGSDGTSGTWWHYTLGDVNGANPFEILPDAELTSNDNGQWGGNGGQGEGYGRGGGIACIGGSSPIISDCILENNIALGAVGGDGGRGGDGLLGADGYAGMGGHGGSGGSAKGDGKGGSLYCEAGSSPVVTNCTFTGNRTSIAVGGQAGAAGNGTELPAMAYQGVDGGSVGKGYLAGGAVYYTGNSHPNLINCTFTDNEASAGTDLFKIYSIGGGLYVDAGLTANIDTCNFTGNLGGAIYFDSGCTVNIHNSFDPNRNCMFTGNSDLSASGLSSNLGPDPGSGGAIFIGNNCTVDMRNCNFTGNLAQYDGGGVECRGDISLTDCSFSNNTAAVYGGGLDLYSGSTLTGDFNGCSFVGNEAAYGGGFAGEAVDVNFVNSYFAGNTAENGGGIDVTYGNIVIIGGGITGNNTTIDTGGGINCRYTTFEIRDCVIENNTSSGDMGTGGGINAYGEASPQLIKNCLINRNYATLFGGGVCVEGSTVVEIRNCTFNENFADGSGGAVFCEGRSFVEISDSIFTACTSHAIHEEVGGGDASVGYSLFYGNPGGAYYDSGTGTTYLDSAVGSIPGGSNNISGNPLFANGDLGGFYLNQSSSPAVNAGSATAISLGLDTYTTDPANAPDSGQVDVGYHYRILDANAVVVKLYTSVVGGSGTLEPAGETEHYIGKSVQLTATPAVGWRVKTWTGTDDDTSTGNTNTVFMNTNKYVTVKFEQPRTLIVALGGGQQGYYTNIQDALNDAEDGDTIVVHPGIYYGGYLGESVRIDDAVTVRSLDPEDPAIVAATIIDGYNQSQFEEGWINSGVIFQSDAVLNGFTIQNCGGRRGDGDPGDREEGHPDGYDGGNAMGGAIWVYPDTHATVKNCIIRDNFVGGGDGGIGVDAEETANAGRGGWGGWAYGGAILCWPGSKATFENCQIVDNYARGGNGGNGGNDTVPGGMENYGGNWSSAEAFDIDPFSLGVTYVEEHLWQVWEASFPDLVDFFVYSPPPWNYIGDGRWYSGYGGAAFCGQNTEVDFIDCTISGNRTYGGITGQGGLNVAGGPIEPLIPYVLPSFGGGVYCAAGSKVTFTDCTLTDNIASDPNDPNTADYHHRDPYLGHGGGVCAEDSAEVIFNDCIFFENQASVGGGLHFGNANPIIIDSTFNANSAYQGGAVFGEHGPAMLLNCDIINNDAAMDANIDESVDPNTQLLIFFGYGGGLHFWAADVDMVDCTISDNQASAVGGGVYFGGGGDSAIFNCLFASNTAGKGGGGVANSIFTQLEISNSTIVQNRATGTDFPARYGGGLYCCDQASTDVSDTIIWANLSQFGSQIAIDQAPAQVSVNYSDVQNGATGVYVGAGCTLNWDDVNNLTGTLGDPLSEPLFVDPNRRFYHLSQPVTGDPNQITIGLSPCVDAGSDDAYSLDLYRHTTQVDVKGDNGEIDAGVVDMGYHYILTTDLVGDLNFDGVVDMADLYRLMLHWLESGCEWPDFCHGADLNQDGRVDVKDYAIFADNYSEEETIAPEPNPMTWFVPPVSTGPSEITMIAATATDNSSGTQVQYRFECVYGGGHTRDWDPCSTYVDTGLATGNKYGYRVKARDTSANLNETGWSFIGYAVPGEIGVIDNAPPTPDPMTWSIVPYGLSDTAIRMVATTATDASGVEYFFDEISGNPGGTDSGWVSDPNYIDTGLVTGLTYTYRVKARDVSANLYETAWSTEEDATTGVEPPPALVAPSIISATQYDGGFYWYNVILADTLAGESALYYRFVCLDDSNLNSGWVPSTGTGPIPSGIVGGIISYDGGGVTYTVPVGPAHMTWQWQVCGSNSPTGDVMECSDPSMVPL